MHAVEVIEEWETGAKTVENSYDLPPVIERYVVSNDEKSDVDQERIDEWEVEADTKEGIENPLPRWSSPPDDDEEAMERWRSAWEKAWKARR